MRGKRTKELCAGAGPIMRRNDPLEFARAIADFDQAIKLDPAFGLAYAHRADAKFDVGNYEGALRDAEHAVRLRPDDAWVRGLRGRIRVLAGKLDGAERDLNAALALNPELDWAYGRLAELRWRKGDAKSSLELLDKSLDGRFKRNPSSSMLRAGLLIKMKKWSAALDDLNECVRIPDCTPVVFRLREHARCELGDYAGAIDDLEFLAARCPSYAANWDYKPDPYQFAVSEHTLPDLLSLLRRHPLYSQGHVWIGECLIGLGRPEKALPHLEKALALRPHSSWANFWKAEALKMSGKFPEAVECLDDALSRVPRHSRARFLRGELKLHSGDRKGALRDMEGAVRWNPLDAGMRRRWDEARGASRSRPKTRR